MKEELKQLVKDTWCSYFNGAQEEIIKNLAPEIKDQYREAMLRLETDFDLQTELEKTNFMSYMMTSDSLKAADVMKILNISRVTLCHYVKRGLIEIDTNYSGGQYRYNRDSVMKLKNK